MKSNPIGSLTDGYSFGTFGEILQFMLRSLFWLTFWPLLLSVARAQAETAAPRFEFGRPIFHYFTMRDYGASDQNWVALQDKQGRMLFGNRDCILVYDGYLWQQIQVPQGVFIRALVMDQAGTIWVGGWTVLASSCSRETLTNLDRWLNYFLSSRGPSETAGARSARETKFISLPTRHS